MPVPVPFSPTPHAVTTEEIALAETFVSILAQIFGYGTEGATPGAPATTFQDKSLVDPVTRLPVLVPFLIDTPEKQLYYRQLALALARAFSAGGTGALPSSDVSVAPGPSLVPRADATGYLDPGWFAVTSQQTVFESTCPATALVGDLVFVSGGNAVEQVNIADETKLPSVGCIIEKPTSETCSVQTTGLVTGLYAGLVPGQSYYAGADSRPLAGAPVPDVGESVFVQPIGVALDPVTLILMPSVVLTRIHG